MIFDLLSRAHLYRDVHSRLRAAFDWLKDFDHATPDSRIAIDGDDLFALVQCYLPAPATKKSFEAHRCYADLQYIVAGEEVLHYSPLEQVRETTPYSVEQDFALFTGQVSTPVIFNTDSFALLFPHDAHKPGCLGLSAGALKKVVIKIRL